VTSYDLQTGITGRFELHDRLQLDDHDSPAFLARPDGRILAFYAKHGPENRFYYRISGVNDPGTWSPVREFAPSGTTRLTYSNLYRLSAERNRIYDFFRGLDGKSKPSYAFSDDGGENWKTGGIVIQSPAARPYVRYASDGVSSIHMFYTEGHPRDFDNSVYHVSEGLREPDEGTRIFEGGPDQVAWTADIELDVKGYPYVGYSVQMDSAGLPSRQGGEDLRYRYARWDGRQWRDYPMAYAGGRLYAGEDDYSGLVALHPHDPATVFISTDADPASGRPLVSGTDGRRHYEIFKGNTPDGGKAWTWTPVTRDSTVDNLRPIVPKWPGSRTALLWLRGTYRAYTDYDLEVVGRIFDRAP
jgi:hypothetical protein